MADEKRGLIRRKARALNLIQAYAVKSKFARCGLVACNINVWHWTASAATEVDVDGCGATLLDAVEAWAKKAGLATEKED